MQEAPLPVMPVAQVNVSLVKTLEALTVIIENLWNSDAGQPPENLIHAIQESRQMLQTSSVIMSQEGGVALDTGFNAGQDPELLDLDEDEAEEMADFEEARAPGGPPDEATVSRARKTATVNTPITPAPKKTRTAAPADAVEPSPRKPKGCQLEPPLRNCCRVSGDASNESQSQSCSQGLRSSAAEGTPRLTQGMEQAMDVQMADVQMAVPNERVACRAALQVVPAPFPSW